MKSIQTKNQSIKTKYFQAVKNFTQTCNSTETRLKFASGSEANAKEFLDTMKDCKKVVSRVRRK